MNAEPRVDYFIDSNILVYAFDRSAGNKHFLASDLVKTCWQNENGCLSLQVLVEFFFTVTRKITAPLNQQTARQIVADLAHWRLHTPLASDLLQAIDFQHTYQLAFWDAQIVQSATCLGCKMLYSEDLNHGQVYAEIKVVNPFMEVA
jgi:predicted nucleic acid-binding protein